MIDAKRLYEFCQTKAERICQDFFPQGKRDGHEWHIGDSSGKAGNSLGIELQGPKAGQWFDHATGEGGDLIKLIGDSRNLTYPQVAEEIERAYGVSFQVNGEKPKPIKTTSFAWSAYVSNVTDADLEELAKWRGLSPKFCRWLKTNQDIGRDKAGQWAFPVQYDGKIVAAHIRLNEPNEKGKHDWLYVPKLSELGIKVQPLTIGTLNDADTKLFAGESQWDLFAILDRLGIHNDEEIAAVATRGSSNSRLLSDVQGEIYLVPQNDEAGRKWLDEAILYIGRAVKVLEVPGAYNDANDWLKTCADGGPLVAAIQNAKTVGEQEKPWSEALIIGGCSSLALSTITIKPRERIIDDWCRDGDLGFIFAKRGIGKTMLGMHLAKGLAIKRDVGPWKIHEQRKVLYLDGEMPAPDIKLRDYALGDLTENLIYLNHEILFERTGKIMNLASPDFQKAVLEFCQAGRFNDLFLDNLSTLTSGVNENDSMDWEIIQPWLLRLRRAHITVFFIHHAGRNNEMRGTSKREDPSFWVLRLDAPNNAELRKGANFITRFTKWRNATQQPKTYEWLYNPGENGEVVVTTKEASPLQICYNLIENGLDTCSEIAAEMGVTNGYVSQLATAGEREGWLKKEKRRYAITGPPPE